MMQEDFEGKRLAYVTDAGIPSQEANSIQTMKMCEAFAKQGLEVTLFVPNRSYQKNDNPFEFYDVDECFEIARLPWKPGERYLFSIIVPFYLRRSKPDIVFGRFIPACFFSALAGHDVVIESHSPVSESQRIIEWMFQLLLRTGRLKHLVVISDALQVHYLETYNRLSSDDVTVAHDAASDPLKGNSLPFSEYDRLQVGYVGQLYPGKGMSLIAELVESCPWADFHIIGGSDQDIAYWQGKIGMCENVEFHGFVPHREVARYQQSMDVLLAPYQREVYGSSGKIDLSQWMSPLKIFEYMAVGGTIISSDLAVLREILKDGETAILCDPEDVPEWEDALELLAKDREFADRLGENSRRTYLNEYTFNKRAVDILSASI